MATIDPVKIMVVDDDGDLRSMLAAWLSGAGYEVVEAAEGHEALELVRLSPPPALIITDLKMPRMNGFRMIANLRKQQQLAAIPLILSSGEAMLPDIAAAVGAAGWFEKPWSVQILLAIVAKVLTARRGEAEVSP